ncbi:hypothetical protein [Limibacillus sp. MBR-115]|uniref:hypothetical protein n=1 Tax=Limibacillus sp. MBR-115 TaxID=3156465 RepID=UPI003397440F
MPRDGLNTSLRETLMGLARCRRTITYRDLAIVANVPSPCAIHSITVALEQMIREDAAAGRPLLAALVVSRSQPGLPGKGFFQLISELGLYDGPDHGAAAIEYHQEEVEMACAYWGEGDCLL